MYRLRRTARRLRNRFVPTGVILLYHRIAEVDADPWSLCVSPRHFAEHMEVLRAQAHPVPLRDLPGALQHGKHLHRPVAVTFDDGYADNLHQARPLLEQHDIPATVFVTAGYVGSSRAFWWDELEQLLLRPDTLPGDLCLSIRGRTYHWALGTAARRSAADAQRYHTWRVEQQEGLDPRQHLYLALWKLLRPLHEDERRTILDDLRSWSRVGTQSAGTPRALSPEDVRTLARDELVEVGAHTVHHPSLPVLSPAQQQEEIVQSRKCLEEMLGEPVRSFAYPYGDHTAKSVELVRDAGFTRACVTVETSVQRTADPLQLPRFEVRDWDGETFARKLSRWMYQ